MHDITKADSENAKKRLIAMCNPRYLGSLNIEEFDNVYEWWNINRKSLYSFYVLLFW